MHFEEKLQSSVNLPVLLYQLKVLWFHPSVVLCKHSHCLFPWLNSIQFHSNLFV